ncbi:MAG: hypothetical protein PF637_12310 [Spirochaetes bacterium]|jgi:hypothetical protein|nr:hypothetical protein [Spirochaetota bacterium]
MTKSLIIILAVITVSSIYAMPSATRRRINASVSGGYLHTKDQYLVGRFSDSSDVRMDYDDGPIALAGLYYNSTNRLGIGIESGYLNISYRDETVHIAPVGINFWSDNSFAQGLIVLRLGFNLSYMNVLDHDYISYGLAAGPQLSFCYELYDNIYITTSVRYLYFNLFDKREDGHGSTLVPMTVGVIFRL